MAENSTQQFNFLEPSLPDNLLRVNNSTSGLHVVGSDTFQLNNFKLISPFQRKSPLFDSTIIAILSVAALALLVELIYIILLRTPRSHRNSISKQQLFFAFLFYEVVHLRNVVHSLSAIARPSQPNQPCQCEECASVSSDSSATSEWSTVDKTGFSRPETLNVPAKVSISVALLAFLLLSLSVAILVGTRPITFKSGRTGYNLQGVHPVLSSAEVAKKVFHTGDATVCSTPRMLGEQQQLQKRRFMLVSCVKFVEVLPPDFNQSSFVNDVSFGTWFHEAGFYHRISFGKSWLDVSARVRLVPTDSSTSVRLSAPRYVSFQSRDESSFMLARHLHEWALFRAKSAMCEKLGAAKCAAHNISSTTAASRTRLYTRKIKMPNGKNKNVTGMISDFDDAIFDPLNSLRQAMHVLGASAVVAEMADGARYLAGPEGGAVSDGDLDGVEGLLEEGGRFVGVSVLALIVALLSALVFALRGLMRPISMGRLAWSRAEDALDYYDLLAPATISSAASQGDSDSRYAVW